MSDQVIKETCEAKHKGVDEGLSALKEEVSELRTDIKEIKAIVAQLSASHKKADVFDKLVLVFVGALVGGLGNKLFEFLTK